jgi:hypothetical protein
VHEYCQAGRRPRECSCDAVRRHGNVAPTDAHTHSDSERFQVSPEPVTGRRIQPGQDQVACRLSAEWPPCACGQRCCVPGRRADRRPRRPDSLVGAPRDHVMDHLHR